MPYQGVDVSIYQTQNGIDWKAVSDHGIAFVMIRVGWCSPDGDLHPADHHFYLNMRDAAAAGLHVGAYIYSYALTACAAQKAAKQTARMVSGLQIDYPVAFGVEDSTLTQNLNRSQITNTVIAFCEEIKQQGFLPMFYTYLNFAQNWLDLDLLSDYEFWLARYAAQPQPVRRVDIWQYTGSLTCCGIHGPCDHNISYKDYSTILRERKKELHNPSSKNDNKNRKFLFSQTTKWISSFKAKLGPIIKQIRHVIQKFTKKDL